MILVVHSVGSQNAAAMTPGVVMYHTPQGIVYAPTTLQDASRSMFNFQQTPTALSLPQSENGQQIITIPIPVSLAGNSQVKKTAALCPDTSFNMNDLPWIYFSRQSVTNLIYKQNKQQSKNFHIYLSLIKISLLLLSSSGSDGHRK